MGTQNHGSKTKMLWLPGCKLSYKTLCNLVAYCFKGVKCHYDEVLTQRKGIMKLKEGACNVQKLKHGNKNYQPYHIDGNWNGINRFYWLLL